MPRTGSFQRFLAELRRRGVFRAATVYCAAAFVVIQAADVIFPRIPLPGWTVTLVVWLCLLGFPLAVALAWVFERTPEGVRRTDEAEEGELRRLAAQPRRLRRMAVTAAAGLVLLLAGGWWALRGPLAGGGSYESIAVLPFQDLSREDDQYFADGLAEELLNALANVPGLRVAARTSSFTFRDREADVREIGTALNVETVLEGSVRRQDDRLRVTAQLIDARTGFHLWSEEYDRAGADVFRVQDEVAASIVNALAIRLSGDVPDQLFRGGTEDPVAYDLYLQGRQLWAGRRIPDLRVAIRKFEEAVARDSSFALAWSGLADGIDALAFRVPEEGVRVPEARYAAERALVLEPQLAEAWASLGVLALDFDRDWSFAEPAFRRALELRPSYAQAHRWLADLYRLSGSVRQSLKPARLAVDLDPLSGPTLSGLYETYVRLGDWPAARLMVDSLIGVGYSDARMLASIVARGELLGFDADELVVRAETWAREAEWPDPRAAGVIGRAVLDPALRNQALALLAEMENAGVSPYEVGILALALHDEASALNRLERAVAAGYPATVNAGTDPTWDPVRADPRMVRLMAELGLPNGYDPATDGF